MEIKDLQAYLTISDEKSLTQASRKLYMSPQGLSKIVKKLESELNCKLFTRTATGMELTESGERLYRHAVLAVQDYAEMKADIEDIERRKQNIVHLVSAFGILRLLTPECITAFRREHPDIEFSYSEYKDSITEKIYKDRKANVAFSISDFDDEILCTSNVQKLASFPIKLLVYQGHPLSYRDSVTIQDLKDQDLYIEGSEFKIHHKIVERCLEAGFEPHIVFETSGFSLCHKMVHEMKGISVTVDFMLEDMFESNLKMIPFSDGEYNWDICMLTRKSEEDNTAINLFRAHIHRWIQGLRDGRITR